MYIVLPLLHFIYRLCGRKLYPKKKYFYYFSWECVVYRYKEAAHR